MRGHAEEAGSRQAVLCGWLLLGFDGLGDDGVLPAPSVTVAITVNFTLFWVFSFLTAFLENLSVTG